MKIYKKYKLISWLIYGILYAQKRMNYKGRKNIKPIKENIDS